MRVVIVGGGNMGVTYAHCLLRSRLITKQDLFILEKSNAKIDELSAEDLCNVTNDAKVCLPIADIIILAVKPQDTHNLFKQINPYVGPQQMALSIMAGISISSICQGLGTPKVVRAMPNLPAQIGSGMTVYSSTNEVSRLELVMAQNLLNTTGKAIYVGDEKMIDAATAVSGSGPAYVYFFMKSIKETAEQLGFTPAEAELLTSQTFQGAVDLYVNHEFSCEDWIKKVSSRGGTTEAALNQYQTNDLKSNIQKGVLSAFKRARELGQLTTSNTSE